MTADWDAIAAEIGMPPDWREIGHDSPEYMAAPDSLYQEERFVSGDYVRTGWMKCVWPKCRFRTKDIEAMFRHAHNLAIHGWTP